MTTVYNEECVSSSHILYLNIKLKHYPDNTPVQVDLDSLYSETIIQIGFQNTICIENITRMNCWLYYISAKDIKIHFVPKLVEQKR